MTARIAPPHHNMSRCYHSSTCVSSCLALPVLAALLDDVWQMEGVRDEHGMPLSRNPEGGRGLGWVQQPSSAVLGHLPALQRVACTQWLFKIGSDLMLHKLLASKLGPDGQHQS
ncbi:uncharacterized protein LY79DRAFT_43110 [Colletotrichum navitas]|uniref:Uncharacterized protein n=1 Tax=Colletotrichum navitas TaxID=681940 RepID=A0AAD8V024_9PEZI|nr:uncharacterized protein LY79DRAFT_43110 [Colletotrichum navitas]KAK1572760.1 hypothetical protein LY79DRAFT_43110 [Colletotrichum navitas]